MVFSKCFK